MITSWQSLVLPLLAVVLLQIRLVRHSILAPQSPKHVMEQDTFGAKLYQ